MGRWGGRLLLAHAGEGGAQPRGQEEARRKKAAAEARAALRGLEGCADLVRMDCGRGGTCRLDAAAALRSPLCAGEAALERAKALCDDGGLEGDERAQKARPSCARAHPPHTPTPPASPVDERTRRTRRVGRRAAAPAWPAPVG